MELVNGSQILGRALRKQGVDTILNPCDIRIK